MFRIPSVVAGRSCMISRLFCAALFSGALSMNTQAAIFYVDASLAVDTGDCLTIQKACGDLSLAINKADTGDEIWLTQGDHIITSSLSIVKGISLKGGYSPDFLSISNRYDQTVITTNPSAELDKLFVIESTNAVSFENITLTGIEQLTSSTTVIAVNDGSSLMFKNIWINSNVTALGALSASGALLTIERTKFSNNVANSGGALNMKGGELILSDVTFENNESNSDVSMEVKGGGAIHLEDVTATLDRVLFTKNKAAMYGGAMLLDGSTKAVVQNVTFFNNKAGASVDSTSGWGGGIAIAGSNLTLHYSTLFDNTAFVGGGIFAIAGQNGDNSASTINLFGNLFLANLAGESNANLVIDAAAVNATDYGNNIFGYNDQSGLQAISGGLVEEVTLQTLFDQEGLKENERSRTLAETNIESIIVDVGGPKNNGGLVDSIKITHKGPAIDQIASANAPFFGVGKSCEYAFTTIQQAHSAIKFFDGYEAGDYFFDLSKEDAESAGICTQGFKARVDSDGWITITSENKGFITSDMYDEILGNFQEPPFLVRSSNNFCDGTKTNTDIRGLPRVDAIDPDDPNQLGELRRCDIGAFEYNDAYRIDCHDEDGLRHSNQRDAFGNPLTGKKFCIGGDLTDVSPQVFFNNIGYVHWSVFVIGGLLLGFRHRLRPNKQAS